MHVLGGSQLKEFQSSLELSPECNPSSPEVGDTCIVFQSSLELSPECNGFILACVLDGVQEWLCANPSKKGAAARWRRVRRKRVFNVP